MSIEKVATQVLKNILFQNILCWWKEPLHHLGKRRGPFSILMLFLRLAPRLWMLWQNFIEMDKIS